MKLIPCERELNCMCPVLHSQECVFLLSKITCFKLFFFSAGLWKAFSKQCCLSGDQQCFSAVYRWTTRPRCCRGNFRRPLSKRWSRGMTSLIRTPTASQMKVNKWQIICHGGDRCFSLLIRRAVSAGETCSVSFTVKLAVDDVES